MAKKDDKPSVTNSVNSLNDPFDAGVSLRHHGQGSGAESRPVVGSEDMIDRAVENTVVKAIF
ncbi:MAG: hypothetical protein KMY53_09520 [Desulfarculus sp.]|nr:hypothetical protein [Desulfarculus sp.]MBV1738389.1 hypothetical protein [Desulfarculus sp.]MBV1753360.1 hypothetical protein [Desulfarculus sp.]